jgi:hypothetical protein
LAERMQVYFPNPFALEGKYLAQNLTNEVWQFVGFPLESKYRGIC